MKKILNIVTSPMGTASNSTRLQNAIVEKLKTKYPGSAVTERNLGKQMYPHLEEAQLAAFFAPQGSEGLEAARHSDEAIEELKNADIIVISAPMYNFGIPSALKAWIDHVVRAGKTFGFSPAGMPEGKLLNKKVYLAISTGGMYSDGPMKQYDFVEPYLRSVLGFTGLTDITAWRVEGVAVPGVKETALQNAIDRINLN